MAPPIEIRLLGSQPYLPCIEAMQARIDQRASLNLGASGDEIWCLEHPPVYTLGQAASPHHVLAPGQIPVVQADRGGEVTYHGPGQVVLYPIIALRPRGLLVRALVGHMEDSLLRFLAELGLSGAHRRPGEPGIYVQQPSAPGGYAKLASLGLRIRKGHSSHGLALNLDMDLAPFRGINPCGYAGLTVTDLASLGLRPDWTTSALRLAALLRDAIEAHTAFDPGEDGRSSLLFQNSDEQARP